MEKIPEKLSNKPMKKFEYKIDIAAAGQKCMEHD